MALLPSLTGLNCTKWRRGNVKLGGRAKCLSLELLAQIRTRTTSLRSIRKGGSPTGLIGLANNTAIDKEDHTQLI